jgi:uncharacterized protein YukE
VTAEISLHDPALEEARRTAVDVHDDMRRRLQSLAEASRDLFAHGWSGPAAEQYAAAWHDWERGADLVLGSLSGLSAAMGEARRQLWASDTRAGLDAAYLRGRLEEPR